MNVLRHLKSLKSKNFLKLVTLFFLISMSFWNCEKDDNIISFSEQISPKLDIKFLSSKEIGSDILLAINSKIGYNTSTTSKNGNNQNSLDLDNIVKVIDSLGNTNYTFRLKVNDDNTATFYNLIVNESYNFYRALYLCT